MRGFVDRIVLICPQRQWLFLFFLQGLLLVVGHHQKENEVMKDVHAERSAEDFNSGRGR